MIPFVYGSLTVPQVLDVVIGRVPTMTSSALTDWQVVALRDRVFPGLVAQAGSTASGFTLDDLSAQEERAIAAFEGPIYRLEPVTLGDGRTACAYVMAELSITTEVMWDRARFIQTELDTYLERCRRWRDLYDRGALVGIQRLGGTKC